MEGRASGGAKSLWRKRAGRAGLAGGCRDRSGGAEGGCRAQDGSDIAGVLYASKNYEKRRAGGSRSAEQLIESGRAWLNERRDSLWVFGVGEAFEKAVCGVKSGKGEFRSANQRSKTVMMALAGFTEKHGFDAAAGAKCFLDEAHAFDADGAGFRWQAAPKRHAKSLEPAIVAAGQNSGRTGGGTGSVAGGFAGGGHGSERSKFWGR